MKRTLLGVVALSAVVGLGSAGVYYARPLLVGATPVSTDAEPDSSVARDTTSTPIPLAIQTVEVRNGQDARPLPSNRPERANVDEDRYADRYTIDNSREESATEARGVALPDASDVAASDEPTSLPRRQSPFGARDGADERTSRYAEQPAMAEASQAEDVEDATTDEPTVAEEEPRRLETPTRREGDRYGRSQPRPTADRYRDEAAEDDARPEKPGRMTPLKDAAIEADHDAATDSSGGEEAGDEGTGRPGVPQLSGSQAPTLTIEKTAPAEIQIGKPAKFTIKVRNAGSVVAQGVEINDSIPRGTQFVDATPAAKRGAQGALTWDLGTLKPGQEEAIELELMPVTEGEIGSVATVHFRAEASVRTVATRPMLNLEVFGPSKVMKGEEITLRVKLSNPGSGAATGVVLSETVPEGLSHPAGNELEFDVGTLKPGESRELELALMASAAGTVTNTIAAQGEARLHAEASTELEVIAPQLQVSMTGPKRRYLERNATHNISVTNPGTASAKDIELVAVLPRELKFVSANNGGQFDAASHSVHWSLEELPPQETGTVTLTTLPQQAGDAKLLIKSTAQQGLKDQREEVVAIEGLAAINFQLSDLHDPIEVNGQTTYEVRVTNQGSKAAGNVRLVAVLPREMQAVSAEGPVRYKIDAQHVVFEPLKQLAPKAETTYTIKVKAVEPGDLRLQVQLTTDEIREPITKEESTRVYGDE